MKTTWHCVVNGGGTVLAVYGEALRAEAEAKHRELALGGLVTVQATYPERPRVGGLYRRFKVVNP